MANTFDNQIRITPSVLDRLIDEEPGAAHEPSASRMQSLHQLKQSVRRDLEWLLNTRQIVYTRQVGDAREILDRLPEGYKELGHSLAAYGLPDFSSISIKSPADQVRMQREIETIISTFEPRLEDVTVTIIEIGNLEQKMRFRIEARLKVKPAPEPVTFDTVLQAGSNQYIVKAA